VQLSPAQTTAATLLAVCTAGVDTASIKVHNITIPANTVVARFSLRNADTGNPGIDDFDMMILAPSGTSTYSGNGASNEAVQIASPAAGAYKVCVTSYDTAGNAPSTYALSQWIVTTADTGGNFNALLPSTVYAGGTSTVGLSWSGLALGKRFLGAVQFKDLSGVVQATTVVRVETNGGLPVTDVPVVTKADN
jgi:hypothetical protein